TPPDRQWPGRQGTGPTATPAGKPMFSLTSSRPSARDGAQSAWARPAPLVLLNPQTDKKTADPPVPACSVRKDEPGLQGHKADRTAKGKKCSQSSKRAASSIAWPPTTC